ncbi:MAG: HAMP domain-containing protein [Chromatiaceae bacterium]|nr:HAMP domain-containing protein [Chromatiaceae bacterium]
MDRIVGQLRIGEKIGLGFALVGLLYLAAIWQYHRGQDALIRDHAQLHFSFVARVNQAFAIQTHLHQARLAEGDFLLHRREADISRVEEQTQLLLGLTRQLAADPELAETGKALDQLARTYQQGFLDIAEAWQIKGLDEDSGLQGAFRRSVHELQQRSRNFNAGDLYVTLLQMRRGEKDLLLRGEEQYVARVQTLIDQFRHLVQQADFYPEVRQALLDEVAVYATTFQDFARSVLAGDEITGGKGPFRDAGHRLEAILATHYVPGLETAILEMRRREKDYLLRGDPAYIRQVQDIAALIRDQIGTAAIAAEDQAQLGALLANYERAFLALVAQNDLIAGLTLGMDQAARDMEPLARQNLEQADQAMVEESARLVVATQRQGRSNLLVVLGAVVLGILFTFFLTRRIVRPVREMAGLLNRLTHESPNERIATLPRSRDELNAMAQSLNTLADHRTRFVQWWKAAMREATALRNLHQAAGEDIRDQALEEIRQAALAQVQQLNGMRGELLKQADQIDQGCQRLRQARPGTLAPEVAQLAESARTIRTLLEVTA